MAGQDLKKIGEELRRITKNTNILKRGIVKAVDESAGTCDVLLSEDEDTITSGVMLNAITGNDNGFILIPKIDSVVWLLVIADTGGLGLIKCSAIDKVLIGASDVEVIINGGENGGMVKVSEVVNKLSALENDLNTLKNVISSWTPVPNDGGALLKTLAATWAGQAFTPTTETELKNDKVKH